MADPGGDTALIIAVRLPAALEAVRQRAVPDARIGLPAHVTLLYPFIPSRSLDDDVRAMIERVTSATRAFAFRLAGQGRWPDTLFVEVDPEQPFRDLQADLAAAFPAVPIYGGSFDFSPHVTVAVGPRAYDPEAVDDPAWRSLPAARSAGVAHLIVRDAEAWRVQWRLAFRPPAVPD
jgi:2'-5' RNA ligase